MVLAIYKVYNSNGGMHVEFYLDRSVCLGPGSCQRDMYTHNQQGTCYHPHMYASKVSVYHTDLDR